MYLENFSKDKPVIKFKEVLDLVTVYLGAFLFMVVCANTRLYIPFTPIPITMHTFAVAILGNLLPLHISLPAFLFYIFEGSIGSPIFRSPVHSLAMGYYFGMFVSIFFLGIMRKNTKMPLFTSLLSTTFIIWFFGVFYLQSIFGFKQALKIGVLAFIIGNFVKLIFAYSFIKFVKKGPFFQAK